MKFFDGKLDLKIPSCAFDTVISIRLWLIAGLCLFLIAIPVIGVTSKFLHSSIIDDLSATPLSTISISATSNDKPLTVEVRPSGSLTTVPKYAVLDITLTAQGSYGNPYLMMPGDNNSPGFVVGEFTGPNGETLIVDGFWDGGDTWKIRFAPISEGVWTYTTLSSDTGLDGHSGSFNSATSNNKGFLRVNPSRPHHFMWDDGTPFYWASAALMIAHFDEAGRDSQGNGWRVDDGTFQGFLDVRTAQGFTATHWGYYGLNKKQFNDRTQQNEGGPPFANYDPDLLNPAYYQYGDQRVEALLNRGILPQFTLGWPDQNIVSNIGHEGLKRYWRYLIARYAAYNIVYNLFGEVQEFGSNYLAIVDDYGQLTRKWDPYDHLLSTHTVGNLDPNFVNLPWLDFITLQLPTQSTSNYLQYNKPVINAEYGGYEDFQVNGDGLRPLIWDIRMRGGYFVYESWGNDLQSSGATYSMLLSTFFQDNTQYWLLEYHPELYNGKHGLANPGQEYVIYLPAGGSVTADLSSAIGDLDVEWFNPRTGEYGGQTTTVGGGNQTFYAPFSGDAVLHLNATPGPSPSATPTEQPTPTSPGQQTPTPTPTQTPIPPEDLITDLVVKSGKTYEIDALAVGKSIYTDRGYTFTSLPAEYQDLAFIRTSNDDKNATEPDLLSFNLTTDGTVYVGYDDRVTTLPGWLDDTWTLTGDIFNTNAGMYRVFQKNFAAGTVILGGNAMSPMQGASSNYTVVVAPCNSQTHHIHLPLVIHP